MNREMPTIYSVKSRQILQLTLLVAILLIATGLRLYKLGEWSYWIEEYHSIRDISGFIDGGLSYLIRSLRPLFFVVASPFTSLFGETEWANRLLPTMVGIITIPVAYVVARKMYTAKTALMTSFLLALAPWHVYWSQNVRFYTLLLLFYTLALYAFYQLIESNQWRYRIASIVFVGLASITHTIGAILIPIFVLYFLLVRYLPDEKPSGLKWHNLLLFIYLPLLAYLAFEVIRLIAQRPLMISVIYQDFFNAETASYVGYNEPIVMLTSVAYYIGVPWIIFAIIGMLSEALRGKREGLLVILGAGIPLALFTIVTAFASTANRYVFMTLFFWLLLSVLGMRFIYRCLQVGRYWPVLGLLALTVIGLWRDPVREDLVHYFSIWQLLLLGVILLIAAGAVGLNWREQNRTAGGIPKTLFFAGVFFAVVHSGLMMFMYFEYQHGHRDDWRGLTEFIDEADKRSGTENQLVAGLTPLAELYWDDDVVSIAETAPADTQLQSGTYWLILDGVVEQVLGPKLDEFLMASCTLMENRDQFTAGHVWPLRAYWCQP